jgi:hypothetical protein
MVGGMVQPAKDKAMRAAAPQAGHGHVPNMAAMTGRLGLDTVPSAWPTGVSRLALAIDICHRCDAFDVCTDWLARAPRAIAAPPAFCPNAAEFKRAKDAKEK